MGRAKRKYPEKFVFTPKSPDKYVGPYPIVSRSSWETQFMMELDTNENCIAWAWESEKIPYTNPETNRQSIYIPDCLVRFRSTDGGDKTVLVEIKPAHEAMQESVKGGADPLILAKNQAKWAAALWFCERRGIEFKVMTEHDLFDTGKAGKKLEGGFTPESGPVRALKQKEHRAKKQKAIKEAKAAVRGNPLLKVPKGPSASKNNKLVRKFK